jgi:threonylcarbamoyladenosine tRNA methylthiotransferase MtaB
VIVGFPGETTKSFEKTVRLLEQAPVTFFHVFSYSERTGTLAAGFPNKVSAAEKKERSHRLIALGQSKRLVFERSFLGKVLRVLVEKRDRASRLQGVAENYIRVHLANSAPNNQIVPVRITEVTPEKVWGEAVVAASAKTASVGEA